MMKPMKQLKISFEIMRHIFRMAWTKYKNNFLKINKQHHPYESILLSHGILNVFTPLQQWGLCLNTHDLFVSLMYCVQAQKKENLLKILFQASIKLKTAVTANVTVVPEPDLTGVAFRAMFHKHLHWCWQFWQ